MVTRRQDQGRGAGTSTQRGGAASGKQLGDAANTRQTADAANTKQLGDAAEGRALAWLQARGLVLVARNYRLAGGPHARGGEIDLIVRDRDGTLVFVEVRARAGSTHGGAAASITAAKQQRLVMTAQHFLLRYAVLPPCRFDVVAVDGDHIRWLQAAFDG